MAVHIAGGVAAVLSVAALLERGGYRVHDFVAEVRDGVTDGTIDCTVAVTRDRNKELLHSLRSLPVVLSAENT